MIIIIMDTYSGKPAQALSAYKFFTHVHIFKIQCIQHKSACTHTHTLVYQGNGTEEKGLQKKGFQGRIKKAAR